MICINYFTNSCCARPYSKMFDFCGQSVSVFFFCKYFCRIPAKQKYVSTYSNIFQWCNFFPFKATHYVFINYITVRDKRMFEL